VTERDRVIAHEAGHAAAAVLLRATPTAIEIRDDGGGVTVPLDVDRDTAHDLLLIALAGRLGHDEPEWPPAWPPSEQRSNDERQAAILAGYLNLDAAGWRTVCGKAWKLAASRPFARLERTFTTALKQSPRLDAKAIDVFEISGVVAPMNNGTRVLATKAADGDDPPMSHTEIERRLAEAGIISRTVGRPARSRRR
jgi:hypothetical protein